MGGVNNAVDYYQNTMKFGVQNPTTKEAIIQNPLLQGGIVRQRTMVKEKEPNCCRSLYIISALLLAV
jgi:hypothetical protein